MIGEQVAGLVADDDVEVSVPVQVAEGRRGKITGVDAIERIGRAGEPGKVRRRAGAGGVGHQDGQRPARRRRVGAVGIGQVLDQRLDRRRRRRAIEGDGERYRRRRRLPCRSPTPPKLTLPRRKADLPGAAALVADRHDVFRQQAGDDQRAAAEVVVGVGEGDVCVEQLRRRVDGVLEEVDGRRQAGRARACHSQPSR